MMQHVLIYIPLKSTLFTIQIRIPVIAMTVYRINVTPPKTPCGIDLATALNFAKKPSSIAKKLPHRMTNGENT